MQARGVVQQCQKDDTAHCISGALCMKLAYNIKRRAG